MVSKGAKAALVLAAVGGVAAVAIVLAKSAKAAGPPPPPGSVASLQLSASVASGLAPLTVTFSGMALSSTGAPVANANIYFFANGALQNFATPVITDAAGTFTFQFTFKAAGTYVVYVSDNTAGT